jgi:excisionase family DNA binding protein
MSEPPCLARLAASVKHSAELLDVSVWQVWKFIRDGEVETFRIGRKRLVTYESLHALIAKKLGATKVGSSTEVGANQKPGAHTPIAGAEQ